MLRIGLTGGIGSGKSTVAKIFETLGTPVYYADVAAKKLLNTDEGLKASIVMHFGEAAYQNGEINRKHLASVVFNNKEKRELLNSLIHPLTIRDAEGWMQKQTTPYVIKESALLFESGAAAHLNQIIGVYAPQELRVKRVMERDGVSAEDVLKRIRGQMDEEMKMKKCHHVIVNNEQSLVIPQVLNLHRLFTGLP